jgi:hypothetical protein
VSMFPYDVNELADGPIRCLYAPIGQALPATIDDVIDSNDPYDPATGWVDFGATAGPMQVARNITTAAYNIQQTTTAVRERITEVVRAVTVNIAELRPDIVAMFEEGQASDATGFSQVAFGNIEDLTQYRMAFLGRRGKDQGVVDEGGTAPTKKRGRLFAYVAYRVQLQAENLQLAFAEGDLANANVNFRLYPEPAEPAGEEHGLWLFEDATAVG